MMPAQTQAAAQQQRNESVNKIELVVDQRINTESTLFQYHRIILQDLPFDGNPTLIAEEHRLAIERLVAKHLRNGYQIRIKKIIGYASKIGDETDNLILSQDRVNEVYQYLLDIVNLGNIPLNSIFHPELNSTERKIGKGESNLPHPTNFELDNPLNRRVEIVYSLKITFPLSTANGGVTSKLWKIDFGPAVAGFFLSGGVGTLTMMPDGENSMTAPVTKDITFEQLGVSMGLFSKLKAVKFIKKVPLIRRLLHQLHPERVANYAKTSAFLGEIGFSVDVINEGGEFETSSALSFDDMQTFNFAIISASLSVLGKGEAAFFLLHSGHFFARTMIFGFGVDITVPDAALNFVPAGRVQVTLS